MGNRGFETRYGPGIGNIKENLISLFDGKTIEIKELDLNEIYSRAITKKAPFENERSDKKFMSNTLELLLDFLLKQAMK